MKKKAWLVSCAVILLCISAVVGVSLAFFTDSLTVKNHLKAGTLDVTLTRTALTYSVLDADGYLRETTLDGKENELALTGSTSANVFGLDENVKAVPGSFFEATLAIGNGGDVAFDYSVTVRLLTEDGKILENEEQINALARQLKLFVMDDAGTVVDECLLSDLYIKNDAQIAVGHMTKTEAVQSFGVKVVFVNDPSNNEAKLQTVRFDLIVTATQASSQD